MRTKKRHRELYHEEIIKSTVVCRRWRIQLYRPSDIQVGLVYTYSVLRSYSVSRTKPRKRRWKERSKVLGRALLKALLVNKGFRRGMHRKAQDFETYGYCTWISAH